MDDHTRFLIRKADERDLEAIVGLERARFGGDGTDCYQQAHVRAWFETCPEGLVVAEHDGRVVGHHYAQRFSFGFDRLSELKTHDESTDFGCTRRTHDLSGNAWYGISLCSILSGAGRALLEHIFREMPECGLSYFVGAARISGFDNYLTTLENGGVRWRDVASESEMALWYSHGCAEMTGAKIWPTMPPKPPLSLTPPESRDPVLNKHIQIPGYGMAALLPGYMRDPPSRDYGVFVVYQSPIHS